MVARCFGKRGFLLSLIFLQLKPFASDNPIIDEIEIFNVDEMQQVI